LWSSSLLLNQEGRETILQGHKDWLEVGSDILTTVTYQCHYGVAGQELVVSPEKMTELLQVGVQLAREAVNDATGKYVVASSGCYGAALADGSEYTGNYPNNIDVSGLVEFHRKKAKMLLDQGPDGLAIETIPSVEETSAVCDVVCSVLQPSVACWISLACQDGERLNEGTPLRNALQAIRDKDPHAQWVHAIGLNCCDSAHIASLLEILTRDMATNGPRRGIVIYPNSGEEWDAAQETWREGTGCANSNEFANRLMNAVKVVQQTWNEHGSGPTPKIIVGGCCRTSPATIAALRRSIDKE
jgi:homocysteine S-methyltransferase